MWHHEIDKEAINKYSGRGEVGIIKKIPEQKRTDDNHRSGWDKKAAKERYQERRCEQMEYRLEILDKLGKRGKVDKYWGFHEQAIRKITSNINDDNVEEAKMKERLNEYIDDPLHLNLLPTLKRHAIKHHRNHDMMKPRAKEERKKAN